MKRAFAIQMLSSGPSALSLLIWEVKSNLVTVFFTEHLLYGGQYTESFTNTGSGTHICKTNVSPLQLLRSLDRPRSQQQDTDSVVDREFVRKPRNLSSALALSQTNTL